MRKPLGVNRRSIAKYKRKNWLETTPAHFRFLTHLRTLASPRPRRERRNDAPRDRDVRRADAA